MRCSHKGVILVDTDNFLFGLTTTASEELVICSSVVVAATSVQLVIGRIALILVYSFSIIKQHFYNFYHFCFQFIYQDHYSVGSLLLHYCNLALIRLYFQVQSYFTPNQNKENTVSHLRYKGNQKILEKIQKRLQPQSSTQPAL